MVPNSQKDTHMSRLTLECLVMTEANNPKQVHINTIQYNVWNAGGLEIEQGMLNPLLDAKSSVDWTFILTDPIVPPGNGIG